MKFVTALFILLVQFTAPLIGGTPVIGATPAKKSPPYYRQRNVTVPQAAQAAGIPAIRYRGGNLDTLLAPHIGAK